MSEPFLSDALCTFSNISRKTGGTGAPISAAFSRMLPSSVVMYQVRTMGVNSISYTWRYSNIFFNSVILA